MRYTLCKYNNIIWSLRKKNIITYDCFIHTEILNNLTVRTLLTEIFPLLCMSNVRSRHFERDFKPSFQLTEFINCIRVQ